MSVEPNIKADVLAYVDQHADEAVGFFQQLVRIKSANPPGDEKDIADACAEYGRALGMQVQQFEPQPRRTSNILRLAGQVGSPVLLFNSHLDTFPPGDVANWSHPPYAAEISDGKVHGVGTRNMKAGLAAALFATRACVDRGVQLRGDLVLSQTADEINGGHLGLCMLVEQKAIKATYGVYTEANPPAKVEIAARGMVWVEVTVHGFAKHTKYKVEPSTSGKPINAIAKMAKIIPAIEDMTFTNWEAHKYIPGPPVISVNMISGGFHMAQTADLCTIRCDCRTLPNQSADDVRRDVQRVVDALASEDAELRADVTVTRAEDSVETAADSEIVVATNAAVEEVTGKLLPLGGVGSTSDMRWLVNQAGIPMCKFMFPSTESGTNEFETVEDYLNTIRVYVVLMLNLLG